MGKRVFDIFFSLTALLALSPVFLGVAMAVGLTSRGGMFFRQRRVGLHGRLFGMLKFRTMYADAPDGILLTTGYADRRLTPIGRWLKKTKLDELPQLINVIRGDMSVVGPRPEVERYVALYDVRQREVLSVRPGITDRASIKYRDESRLLASVSDPVAYYVNVLMPDKLEMGLEYVNERSFVGDLNIIIDTIRAVAPHRKSTPAVETQDISVDPTSL